MTHSFHETRWTLIARSRGDDPVARLALCELCEAYYRPVVAFLRRDGREEDVARELAHDFFARILAGHAIDGATPELGRFRTYLLQALKRFAADQRAKAAALKRGGGQPAFSLDDPETTVAQAPYLLDSTIDAPDAAFDKQWALTLLARAMIQLHTAMEAEGRSTHFHALKPWITAEDHGLPQSTAAEQLGLSIEATKVAIHRLRRTFRDAVKTEIAHTLTDPTRVDEEMQALMAALRS
jgi:RNA polymerase sigma factor (sigma-70 family)